MTKNILVTDANGDIIGTTFPKRAKGLIKSGRASFVDEGTIRMSAGKAPPEHKSIISEETQSMIYITFKGDEWIRRNTDISFMTGLDGTLSETLMLGSWNSGEYVAVSRPYMLTPNTSYSYVFWLNGGENESANEVCNFKIAFFNDWENCNVYRLNRGYIKPLLHQKGWELYEIPFTTPNVDGDVSVTFSFTAERAPMAVMAAKEPAAYSDLKDEPDEYAAYRPQRHNIVFQDGWPSITQYGGDKYSTEAIRKKVAKEDFRKAPPFDADAFEERFNKEFNDKFNKEFKEKFKKDFAFDKDAFMKKFKKDFHFSFSSDDDDEEDELAEEIKELQDEIGDMLDDLEAGLDDVAGDLDDADEDLRDILSDDDFDASKFQSEIDSFTDELSSIGNEIGKYNAVISGLRDAFEDFDEEAIKNRPEAAREALKVLYSSVESAGNSVEELEDRVSDLADDISDLN